LFSSIPLSPIFIYIGCLRDNVTACFIHFSPISSLTSDIAGQCRWLFYPFEPHLFLNGGCLPGNVAGCFIHFNPISSLTSDVCVAMSLVVLSIPAPSLP